MRIRFNVSVAGDRFGYEFDEVVDLDVSEAMRFVRAGQAEVLDTEVAAMEAPERAVKRRGRFRKAVGG